MKFSLMPLFLCLMFPISSAQIPQRDPRPRTASVSGRVTIAGKPAANAVVIIEEFTRGLGGEKIMPGGVVQPRIFAKVRTGGDGRYRFTGLAEGSYVIRALSNAYVSKREDRDEESQITLDNGESRENLNFEFTPGGVITGRVSDAEGRPLIASGIQLIPLNEKGEPKEGVDFDFGDAMMETDDRGVYRLYGLPAGRYFIGASSRRWVTPSNGALPTTYHPDASERKQAKIVEVTEGETTENIDIRFGAARKIYEALGRVIEAETGQPVPHVRVECHGVNENGQINDETQQSAVADEQGRFKLPGLATGRYEVKIGGYWGEMVEHYGEKTGFAINDADVSGLEIKAIRGGTVSGAFVIAGGTDPSVQSRFSQMRLFISVRGKRDPAIADGPAYDHLGGALAKINPDGGFRAAGLPPGSLTFHLDGYRSHSVTINRIERDGVPLTQAIELKRGERIGSLRIMLDTATGSIRGQVRIAGGALPPGWRLHVRAERSGQPREPNELRLFEPRGNFGVMVDEKGRFLFESLPPGDYDVVVSAYVRNGASGAPDAEESKQRVTVSNGAETTATIPFDPRRRKQ